MNKKIKNSGITLISLVITIIIMLILVGVSINLAVNGGLFEYAGNAVGDTKNAMKNEQDLVNTIIDDYIKKYTGEKEHEWTREGDTFKCKKHPEEIYQMGQAINYTVNGEATLYWDRLGVSGQSSNEVKVTSQETEWIVLGIDKETESLLITTSEPVKLSGVDDYGGFLYFGDGKTAYNNGVSEINRICGELFSSEYGQARGMTIEDVNNALNYTPKGGMYDYLSSYYEVEGFNTKLKNLSMWNDIKKTYAYGPDGTDLGEYELNGYFYELNDDGKLTNKVEGNEPVSITDIEKKIIFGENNDYMYFLASRGCRVRLWETENIGRACLSLGSVWEDTVCCSDPDTYQTGGINEARFAFIRPVVSLQDEIPT